MEGFEDEYENPKSELKEGQKQRENKRATKSSGNAPPRHLDAVAAISSGEA